jgi:hypothetical protein
MTIGKKIAFMGTALVMLTALLGGIAIREIGKINRNAEQIVRHNRQA